jgi:hypothetical protein
MTDKAIFIIVIANLIITLAVVVGGAVVILRVRKGYKKTIKPISKKVFFFLDHINKAQSVFDVFTLVRDASAASADSAGAEEIET